MGNNDDDDADDYVIKCGYEFDFNARMINFFERKYIQDDKD